MALILLLWGTPIILKAARRRSTTLLFVGQLLNTFMCSYLRCLDGIPDEQVECWRKEI